MKSPIFKVLVLLLIINQSFSQSSSDSIRSVLLKLKDDTTKVNILLDYTNDFLFTDNDVAMKYSREAYALATKLGDDKAISKSAIGIARLLISNGKSDSCLYYARVAEEICEKNSNLGALADVYDIMFGVYMTQSDVKKALPYVYKSMRIFDQLNDTVSLASTYQKISDLFFEKHDTINAEKYCDKLWEIANVSNNKNILMTAYMQKYNFDQNIEYILRSEKIAIDLNDFDMLAYIYQIMGFYYSDEKHDIKKGLSYFNKGLDYSRKVGNKYVEEYLLLDIADNYREMKQFDSTIYYLEKSMAITDVIGSNDFKVDQYQLLYQLYKSVSKYDSALMYFELSNQIKDSFYNASILNSISDANVKYKTEKKESEIIRQKLKIEESKRKRNQIIFGGIALVLLLALGFQYIISRQKRKNELVLNLKNAEAENLKKLNEMKSRFFANITHEFRTPLTLILGPLKDLKNRIKGNDNEILKIAISNSNKLLELVNDILDLSTLEDGEVEINNCKICLNAFIKKVFYSYESYAIVRQINTELVISSGDDVLVNVDIDKLEKILNNLLSNAFKYTQIGDVIKLVVNIEDELFISVEDSGIGIDETDIKQIFDRYYQGQNSENISGTGIGLSFAYRLAKMMKGSIEVESEKGRGSKFTMRIPIEVVGNCKDKEQDSFFEKSLQEDFNYYKVESLFEGKPKILIVEDNNEMQKYLKSILENNYFLDFAENGFKGLKKLGNNKYDLISSDVMMQGMDGFVFRQEVNKNPEWKNIPFILLTARSLKDDKLRGLKLGVDDYITKPFNTLEYIARINNLIKNKFEREKWISENLSEKEKECNLDSEILRNLEKIVLDNIEKTTFKVNELCLKIGYSQRTLTRVLKKMIGITPVNFILEVRMQKAYQLLKANKYKTISEVRYEVGIDNASYFAKKFFNRFGVKPGDINT